MPLELASLRQKTSCFIPVEDKDIVGQTIQLLQSCFSMFCFTVLGRCNHDNSKAPHPDCHNNKTTIEPLRKYRKAVLIAPCIEKDANCICGRYLTIG